LSITLHGTLEFLISFDLSMQDFVVIIEILREPGGGQVFDIRIENIRHGKAMLLKNIEEKDQLVFSLLPIVNIFLKFED
jgi:hypothetical protein